ncbi:MAG: hypothetical protein M3020_00240, partial [Myxococcota bacterium]|nr:hypothetical protein [Myxococcota bacterium]
VDGGGAGAGGGDVGGAGGGVGGAGEGGFGGSDEVTGGTGGDDGVGGEGGEGGAGSEVPLLECADNGNYPAGDGKDCAEYCDDFFDNCGEYDATDSIYADEAACVAACQGLTVSALCCRAAHANDAAESIEGPEGHCEAAAALEGCP